MMPKSRIPISLIMMRATPTMIPPIPITTAIRLIPEMMRTAPTAETTPTTILPIPAATAIRLIPEMMRTAPTAETIQTTIPPIPITTAIRLIPEMTTMLTIRKLLSRTASEFRSTGILLSMMPTEALTMPM